MAAVEIEIHGFPEAMSDLQLISKESLANTIKALQEGGREIAIDAQDKAPIKTGKLKASIKSTDVPEGADITAGGGTVDYAIFQELGTSKMVGKAFMGSSVLDWLDHIDQRIHEVLPE